MSKLVEAKFEVSYASTSVFEQWIIDADCEHDDDKLLLNEGEFYGSNPREANFQLFARFFDKYPELAERCILSVKVAHITAVEIEVSPWSYKEETKKVIQTAEEFGIVVLAYSPPGNGFLTGKLNSKDLPEHNFRRHYVRFRPEVTTSPLPPPPAGQQPSFRAKYTTKGSSMHSPFTPPPPDTEIKTVNLLGGFNSPFNFQDTTITPAHAVFSPVDLQSRTSPISKLIGIPIAFWRHRQDDPMSHLGSSIRETLDNQSVTYMMINPKTGFAPPQWQQGVGPVTVARLDYQPMSWVDLELIWMFCDDIIEQFGGEVPPSVIAKGYNPSYFKEWCGRYLEQNERNPSLVHLPH
ncbi:hypothetical protein FRB99_001538 [Tulasnella sp. 403]|nr:hypothetical protein FRB99_001538 [Tulasnella sp. 403]